MVIGWSGQKSLWSFYRSDSNLPLSRSWGTQRGSCGSEDGENREREKGLEEHDHLPLLHTGQHRSGSYSGSTHSVCGQADSEHRTSPLGSQRHFSHGDTWKHSQTRNKTFCSNIHHTITIDMRFNHQRTNKSSDLGCASLWELMMSVRFNWWARSYNPANHSTWSILIMLT